MPLFDLSLLGYKVEAHRLEHSQRGIESDVQAFSRFAFRPESGAHTTEVGCLTLRQFECFSV
jgi:hypothetical protein